MNYKEALQQVEDCREALKSAEENLVVTVSESFITCLHCKEKTKVKNLTRIQTHWYERPYSCTGGDQWHAGEVVYDCPKCGKRNRDYFNERLKEFSQWKYKGAFANCTDEHKR